LSNEQNLNQRRPNRIEILVFSIYCIIGIVLKYLTSPTCNSSNAKEFYNIVSSPAVPYLIVLVSIGVGWGILSFFFPNFPRSRSGTAVVTGLGVGIGSFTVFALLSHFCF